MITLLMESGMISPLLHFIEEIVYTDISSTKIAVFMDTNERQYTYIKQSFLRNGMAI